GVWDGDQSVAGAVYDERGHTDRGQHVARVDPTEGANESHRRARAGGQPLELGPPVSEADIVARAGRPRAEGHTRSPVRLEVVRERVEPLLRETERIVVVLQETGEGAVEHERGCVLGKGGREHGGERAAFRDP